MTQGKLRQLETRATALARELTPNGCGHGDHHEGCGHTSLQRRSDVRVSRPSDMDEVRADAVADRMDAGLRAPAGARRVSRAGGAVAEALRPAGPGRPLEEGVRAESEASLATDLSDVRVHDDDRADALSRHLGADGFAVGRDVYFREGVYGSPAAGDRHVVNHELAHVSQGGGDGGAGGGVISRHASWEHRMLGDVDPAVLEVIAAGRDLVQQKKKGKVKRPTQTIQGVDDKQQVRVIDADTVLHAIEQEIERQQAFAKMAPQQRTGASLGKNEAKLINQDGGVDQKWQVHILNITLKDGSVAALSYGEMNTLGDFYGSPEEIAQTDPQQFVNYLYGIREEGIRKFMRLHTEIAKGLGKKTKFSANAGKNKVEDEEGSSEGNTGTYAPLLGGDAWGELKLMGAGITKGESKRLAKDQNDDVRENTGYTGGLARNACHFAPQSWHAWSGYHQKAKVLAGEAWTKREDAKATQDPNQKTALETEADKKQNDALVQNGFGDHFLQDSFAAGHLINKTLIMQWFTKWLDEHPMKRDFTKNASWQSVQNIAYGQEGIAGKDLYDTKLKEGEASDAQSVDNMQGSWQDRFTALGLEIPASVTSGDAPSGQLLLGWQEARRAGKLQKTNVTDIENKYAGRWGVRKGDVEQALLSLINDGVVRFSNYSTGDRKKGAENIGLKGMFGAKTLELTKNYEPKKRPKTTGTDKQDEKANDKTKLGARSQKATYQDYQTFLNHGYIQLSTNMLHNHFCENGLTVYSDAATLPYKIYGDNAMLQKDSAEGVRFSAETSNMSRDAVYDWATKGETENSTAEIEARIPKDVSDANGTKVSLKDWHGDSGSLHKLCWDKVFPDTAAVFSKSSFIFLKDEDLVSASKREKVLKDVKILAEDPETF